MLNVCVLFFSMNRGKNTHPGAVVDLCQNPDDPARVRVYNLIKPFFQHIRQRDSMRCFFDRYSNEY